MGEELRICAKCDETCQEGKFICRLCRNAYAREYKKTPEQRAYARKYFRDRYRNNEDYRKSTKERDKKRIRTNSKLPNKSPEAIVRRREAQKKYRAKDEVKLRIYAGNAVSYALRKGKLTRQPCEKCGSTDDIQAHHESYLKKDRLKVNWFCRKHHMEHHIQLRNQEGSVEGE